MVQVHVLDVEGDVLFGFPADRLGQLGVGHHGQADLLDDDRVARQRRGDIPGARPCALEDAADGIGHADGIDDGAVDDAVRGNRLGGVGTDPVGPARHLQFDRLDGARSDVESDDSFGPSKSKHVRVRPFPKARGLPNYPFRKPDARPITSKTAPKPELPFHLRSVHVQFRQRPGVPNRRENCQPRRPRSGRRRAGLHPGRSSYRSVRCPALQWKCEKVKKGVPQHPRRGGLTRAELTGTIWVCRRLN